MWASFETPQARLRAREAIATLFDGQLGPIRMPAPVPRLSETPGAIRWTGAAPGAHNGAVFRDLLGLSADALSRLSGAGII